MTERELAAVRRLFPITERCAYLRHASAGPLSTPVRAAVEACLDGVQWRGYVGGGDWWERLAHIRALAARLIGASPGEIAFPRNTSHGLLFVANGIPWRAGDVIVTAETEDPANVYPWLHLAQRGVETRFAPAPGGRIAVEDVAALIDERTRLVALSFVEVWTGFRNDLNALGQLCRERGVYFCVDAIQGLGALRLDVRESQIDFMSAGGFKWLLSPSGTGIFYCRRDLLDELAPASAGWRAHEPGEYAPYQAPLYPDARRFTDGSHNWCGLYGLEASLSLLLEFGPEWIESRIHLLTDVLIEGLRERGYPIVSPVASWAERSGIVTFEHPDHPSAELHQRLLAADVIVSHAGKPGYPGLRVAPHFYNTRAEIERLLEALP